MPQRVEHSPQTGEQSTALGTLPGVALHPPPLARTKLAVEVGRHVVGRPPMIEREARAVEEPAHKR